MYWGKVKEKKKHKQAFRKTPFVERNLYQSLLGPPAPSPLNFGTYLDPLKVKCVL